MKKAHILKIMSIVVLLAMFLQPTASFFMTTAAQHDTPEPYRIVIEKDDEGNFLPSYSVDVNGNIVEQESSPIVSASADLPSSYDLRDYGYVTPVKNQAGAGSCWAFASISSLESSMIKQGYKTASSVDYSEAHLSWFGQRQRTTDSSDPTYGDGLQINNPFASGGNWLDATTTLSRGSGLQSEANAPWVEAYDTSVLLNRMSQSESDRYACYARLYQTQYVYDNSVTTAKNLLMANGNLELSYHHAESGYNKSNKCYYQNRNKTLNHAVAVVGWNDNYSTSNFNASMRPSKNGAWLVKGSWDTTFGNNGYYWISYYDTSIQDILSYVAAPVDTYDNIYQYDGAPSLVYFNNSGSIATANRFKSTRNEMLTHVGFFHNNKKPVDLKVEVYRSNSGYAPTTSTNPTKDMTIVSSATTTVSNSYVGYYTIKLNNPVELKKNDYFTVKVTVTDPYKGQVFAMVEGYDYSNYSFSSHRGESFMLFDSTWYDCYNINGTNYRNVPIKAFTANNVVSSSYTLSYDANGGSGAPSPQTSSNECTVSSTVPERFGYTFIGWDTSPTATSARFLPGNNISLSNNTTLYAVWKAASSIGTSSSYNTEISFANQEVYYSFTPSSSGKYVFESTGSLDSQIHFYDSSANQIGHDDDSGDGNNFKLFATLTSGTKYYVKVRAYKTYTGSTSFKVTKDTATTYTISYNANGGTNAPSSQTKTKDASLTLTSAKPSKSYTVTYNANGGSVSPASKSVSCTFKNWNTSQNGSGTSYAPGGSYTTNSAATLYAQWGDPTFGTLATPTRPGYVFNGWFTASAGGTKITSSTTLTGNKTIYAQWTESPYEGMCGDTLSWNFDYTTGRLYISGTGTMYNYDVSSDSEYHIVTTAPWDSFKDEITAIKINEGAKNISDFAFASCVNVTSVSLPESLLTIGNAAFLLCENLKKIVIPKNVRSIGTAVFTLCSRLKEIDVDVSNSYYSDDSFGVLYDARKTTLIHYPAGKTETKYTIFAGTTVISPFAFAFCENLLNITIPKSVRTIGESAFEREKYYINNVYYDGSPTDWNSINIEEYNHFITAPLAMNFTTKVVYKTSEIITNDTFAVSDGYSYSWKVTNGGAKISKNTDGTRCFVDFTRKGNLSIEMVATNGKYTEKVVYNFTVKYTWWQWIIIILLLGWLWY